MERGRERERYGGLARVERGAAQRGNEANREAPQSSRLFLFHHRARTTHHQPTLNSTILGFLECPSTTHHRSSSSHQQQVSENHLWE